MSVALISRSAASADAEVGVRDINGETDIGLYPSVSFFSLFLVFPVPLSAETAGITDLLVTNNATHVLVYARVTNCFTKDMEAAILAGVPTTFTFLVDLYQERSRWLDKKLIRLTVRHTIKYDNRQETLLCLLRRR